MARIYGASDDLLEIEDSDFEEDEISCYNQDVRLRFEDGMVARFHYPKAEDLGVWGCEIESAGSAGYSLSECFGENARSV
ncbi:MAG: hypothetical protein ACLT1A_11555 [Dysosmobacter sp.]